MARFTELRALAFDLDGTLVDSAPGLTEALGRAFIAVGLTPPASGQVTTWIGNGADIMIERALSWALQRQPGAGEQQETRLLFDRYYAETVTTGSHLFPHVAETLAQLSRRSFSLAIVTNKPTPFIAPLLEKLGIARYFSLVLGGDDVVAKKPHPAPLFLVLGRFGLLPGELLFVGDSRNDILAARAAGCPCVGLTFGYNYGEPIAASHPDMVLDDIRHLLPLTEGDKFQG